MKKIISILLTFTMVLCITTSIPLSVSAETTDTKESLTYTDEYGEWTYELTASGDGCIITSYMTNYYENKTDIEIPSKIEDIPVVEIGESAFKFCENLTSVVIPDSIAVIGDSAFLACSSLASITIPNSVNIIEDFAFYACNSLTNITIPNSVTYIDFGAFAYSENLTTITISDGVTFMGESLFTGCDNLTEINVSPNNKNYSSVDGVLFDKMQTTLIQYPAGKKSDDYIFPGTITDIGANAFQDNSSLSKITIPDNVTNIEVRALENCDNLTEINVSPNNPNYSSIDGVLFDKTQTTLIQYPVGKMADSYIIPDRVVAIDDNAFSYCSKLTSITIPKSVTTIGNNAFAYCEGLTSMEIPNSVTTIGYSAFANCSNMVEVILSNKVTSISDYLFTACSRLEEVIIPDNLTTIGYGGFSYCSNLTSIIMPKSVTNISDKAFAECTRFIGVYYSGSRAQWNEISMGDENNCLKNAIVKFNYVNPDIGDANLDGEVSIIDVIILLRHINSSIELTGKKYRNADVNGDGTADIIDAIKIQKIILGKQ